MSEVKEELVNNVMRMAYRPLTEAEQESMRMIKVLGLQFYNLLHGIGSTDMATEKFASRELSLAATKIEEAVMWATKHVTR